MNNPEHTPGSEPPPIPAALPECVEVARNLMSDGDLAAFQAMDRNEDNGFELRYSDYFAVGTPPPVIPPIRGEPVLSLRFTGSEYFQETNLGDVHFVMGKSEEAEILSNCTSPAYPDREQRDRNPPSLGLGLTVLPRGTSMTWSCTELCMRTSATRSCSSSIPPPWGITFREQ